MAPNKAHRYLVSLVRTGLAVQSPINGDYDLGPQIRALGLLAMSRTDPYHVTFEAAAALRDQTGYTVLVTVWGDAGPTVLRWLNGVHRTSITFRLGSSLPLTRSSAGRLFLALLPKAETEPVLRRQMEEPQGVLSDAELVRRLAQIRETGTSISSGEILPGIDALSAPVFGEAGDVLVAMTLLTPDKLGAAQVRAIREALLNTTRETSRALGFSPPQSLTAHESRDRTQKQSKGRRADTSP